MSSSIKIFFIIIALTIISCSGNSGNTRKSKRVPDKDVVSILTDLYLADGLLGLPPVRTVFSKKDSTTNYIEIIKKHGYTKEQMDMTIRYFFIRNPKRLEKIYDEVLARLSEMQSRLATESPPASTPVAPANLWTLATSFVVPDAGVTNPIPFSIPVKDTGTYELSMTIVVYPDDKSLNPTINVFFWHTDGTEPGVRDYWAPVVLPKDGLRHNYTLSKKLTDKTFTHFNGWLLYSEPRPGRWEKHAIIENILLRKI